MKRLKSLVLCGFNVHMKEKNQMQDEAVFLY